MRSSSFSNYKLVLVDYRGLLLNVMIYAFIFIPPIDRIFSRPFINSFGPLNEGQKARIHITGCKQLHEAEVKGTRFFQIIHIFLMNICQLFKVHWLLQKKLYTYSNLSSNQHLKVSFQDPCSSPLCHSHPR